MQIDEWHCFLDRYHSTATLAKEEYACWLAEFEQEHGEKAREEYEEKKMLDG